MKIRLVLLKLLFLGALLIISNNNLHLSDREERGEFFNYYSSWIGNIFDQGVEVTSYVVKFEWLPKTNSTYAGDIEKVNSSAKSNDKRKV